MTNWNRQTLPDLWLLLYVATLPERSTPSLAPRRSFPFRLLKRERENEKACASRRTRMLCAMNTLNTKRDEMRVSTRMLCRDVARFRKQYSRARGREKGAPTRCARTFSENHGSGCFRCCEFKKKNCFCAADKMRPRHGIYTGADVHANGVWPGSVHEIENEKKREKEREMDGTVLLRRTRRLWSRTRKKKKGRKKKKSVVVVCVCARALRNRKLPRAVAAALPSVNSNQ